MAVHRVTGKKKILRNKSEARPVIPFYSLFIQLNNGQLLSFQTLRGKKVMLVNTASDCGYTAQYAELQALYEKAGGNLEIIAFPANDFREQEKRSDEEIENFCRQYFSIRFRLAKKSSVVKSENQNTIFKWLSSKDQNGWNDQQPTWNFCKYLVDERGFLTHFFDQGVPPLDEEVTKAAGIKAP